MSLRSTLDRLAYAKRDGRLFPMASSWLRALATLPHNPAAGHVTIHAPAYVEPDPADLPLVRRIFTAYRRMKAAQKEASPTYLPSSLWQGQLDLAYANLNSALAADDVAPIQFFLANFGAWEEYTGVNWSPLIRGASGSLLKSRHLQNEVFFRQVAIWKWMYGNRIPLSALAQPRHGNQLGAIVDGQFMTVSSFPFEVYGRILADALRLRSRPRIAELGAGYGIQAYYLLSHFQSAAFVDFDLPETLCLAAFYLSKSFPDKTMLLFGEEDFSVSSLDRFDLILMPSFEIEKLGPRSVDMFINEFSLGEMSPGAASHFIGQIARTTDYFFEANRDRLRNVYSDAEQGLLGFEYPMPPDQFVTLFRYPDVFHLTNRGFFNLASDTMAYLYGRDMLATAR